MDSTPTTDSAPTPPPPAFAVRPAPTSSFPILPVQLPFYSRRTSFRHPGYPDGDNVLFTLSPLDDGGVHHGTALSACIIFACNAKGYLVESRRDPPDLPTAPTARPYDEILRAPDYYFYTTIESTSPYPVCPSFKYWVFPNQPQSVIPLDWYIALSEPEPLQDVPPVLPMGSSQMTYAVTIRDQSCRMSGGQDVCQNAHLVPVAQFDWFDRNHLRAWNLNPALSRPDTINDIRNGILLRQELHTAFDAHKFTFTVKCGKLVSHFLTPTAELGRQFHNCELRRIRDSQPEYFFARFALSIFPMIDSFASSPGRLISKNGCVPEQVPSRTTTKRKRNPNTQTPASAGDGDNREGNQTGSVSVSIGMSLPSTTTTTTAAPAPQSDVSLEAISSPARKKHQRHPSDGIGSPGTKTLWHDQVLSEPYDSSDEEREDAEIADWYFPTLFDPATRSQSVPKGFYEDINFYPKQRSVQRCKARWIKDHPNIHTVASESQGGEAGKEEE